MNGTSKSRRGLTLLEALVSVAILGASMTALGVLISVGSRAAENAREGTTAQIICESIMSEVTAGSIPAAAAGPLVYDPEGIWYYTIDVQPVQTVPLPLLEVHVVVEEGFAQGRQPISFELVRWMPDPTVELPTDAAATMSEEGEEDPTLQEGF